MSDELTQIGEDAEPDSPERNEGGYGGPELEEARQTVLEIMRGKGGRNARARLSAAKAVLGIDWVEQMSDESLLAELKRRTGGQ